MPLRRLQLVLLVAALAAGAIMAGVFPTGIQLVCLALIVGAAAITAGERTRSGGGWWILLAAGALCSVLGAALAEASEAAETVGGLIAIAGSALVLIAAAVGFPLGYSADA